MLATNLQAKANQVFERENAAREGRNDDTFMSRSGPLPPTSPGNINLRYVSYVRIAISTY